MKNLLNVIFLSLSLIFFFSCKGSKGDKSVEAGVEISEDTGFAVCIWDKASLKEAPEEKGKWLQSISLGEKCEYLDNTKEDNSGSKVMKFYKIRLQDGKEGWVQADLISLNSKPAALNQDAELYARPDLLTKTNKSFSEMDVVAVKGTQGNFIEITGKRKGGKWIESGWIKSDKVTYSDEDIAVAKFAGKALQITDVAKQREAINEILKNDDMKNSIFIEELRAIVDTTSVSKESEQVEGGDAGGDGEEAAEVPEN